MFFFAPVLSKFYEQPEMTDVIRALSLTLLMGGINAVQQARVSRRMEFKLFFKATLIGTIFSAFVGIGMAMAGLGVWALVGQILSNQLVNTIVLWMTIDWKPSFTSRSSASSLYIGLDGGCSFQGYWIRCIRIFALC